MFPGQVDKVRYYKDIKKDQTNLKNFAHDVEERKACTSILEVFRVVTIFCQHLNYKD